MSFLVDTDVLSELARPRPDRGVVEWAEKVSRISLSAVTVEEIWFGLSWKPNQRVQQWFESFFSEHCEVLWEDEAIARHAGRLRGEFSARGQKRTQADMLIAATAAIRGLVIVTRNQRDFEGCGVPILNPFSR